MSVNADCLEKIFTVQAIRPVQESKWPCPKSRDKRRLIFGPENINCMAKVATDNLDWRDFTWKFVSHCNTPTESTRAMWRHTQTAMWLAGPVQELGFGSRSGFTLVNGYFRIQVRVLVRVRVRNVSDRNISVGISRPKIRHWADAYLAIRGKRFRVQGKCWPLDWDILNFLATVNCLDWIPMREVGLPENSRYTLEQQSWTMFNYRPGSRHLSPGIETWLIGRSMNLKSWIDYEN